MNTIGEIKDKNILFLQGPIGSFFKRLDLHFRKKGAKTFKITLNSADWFFSNKDNTYPFKGKQEEWEDFFKELILTYDIHKLFLFGDCRFYQSCAIKIAKQKNIDIFVFEEGYIRPNFITMERYGVNDFSHISREKKFYQKLNHPFIDPSEVLPSKSNYLYIAFSAVFYYIIADLFSFRYPHYQHHRELFATKEFFIWCRSMIRKLFYKITQKNILKKLTSTLSKQYYFVPLQTYNDFQVTQHSNFSSIEEFIETVMKSFSLYAPKKSYLLFKHHPQDRGRKNYTYFIQTLSKKYHLNRRIIIIHDLHLPTCLKHAKATITINSTVGMSSLYHQIPTITLGHAIYNIEELTNKNMPLDKFWHHYCKPNQTLFMKFRTYIIANTQLNGSFYGRFPIEFYQDKMFNSLK